MTADALFTEGSGARGAKVEPLAWPVLEPIQWRELRFDLGMLARLRFIEGYTQTQLARYLGKSVVSIQNHYSELRKCDLSTLGLAPKELEKIRCRLSSKE